MRQVPQVRLEGGWPSDLGELVEAHFQDCTVQRVRYARACSDRPDYDLASATPGTFALAPHADMADALARDYRDMVGMIFGTTPAFDEVLASITAIEGAITTVAP